MRILFAIAERLHQPLTVVERMSVREVQGWIDYWSQPAAADDDAIDLSTLSQADRRAMFPGR